MSNKLLDLAFNPRSVAVVGASTNTFSMGYSYLNHLTTYGFKGQIYPVTPSYPEVLGYKAYPGLKDVPEPIDYVICCLSASKVPDLLRECSEKNVGIIHLFTGRFSETGQKEAKRLEDEVLRLVNKFGIRLIGPNCIGIYNPGQGLSFAYDLPSEPGKAGLVFQSGGACAELVYYASQRGIRFSKVVSYGNALDLDESDMLEYLAKDQETEIIACYIEGVKDGNKFIHSLKQAIAVKPVIILKAGRSSAGSKAAASHTASMAGDLNIWESSVRQAGAVMAHSIEDMIDLMVSFYFMPSIKGNRVGIVGGGGGSSVLSADEWEKAGFDIPPLSSQIRERIKQILPEMWWDWLGNPLDLSIFPKEARNIDLNYEAMKIMTQSEDYDLVAANFSIGAPVSKEQLVIRLRDYTKNIIELDKNKTNPIAVVLNTGVLSPGDFEDEKWKTLAGMMSKLVARGIPVYSNPNRASRALGRFLKYCSRGDNLNVA